MQLLHDILEELAQCKHELPMSAIADCRGGRDDAQRRLGNYAIDNVSLGCVMTVGCIIGER
jgi:hypothetical protein